MLIQQTINKANVGFKTIFNKVFEETKTSFEEIATIVPSNNKIESYNWLGSMPMLRKWVGDKVIKNIQEHDYTIKNEPFEATISISKFDMQDDNLGIYKPQVESLAQSAKLHPEQLVFETLEKGFTEKCYDGVAFFGTHKVGKKTYKNFTDKKLTLENYILARKTMMGLKNEEGKPLRIMPNLLVVPPSLEKEAMEIVKADFINGSSNISRSGNDEDNRENNYYLRYKNAIKFLENVAKGTIDLTPDDNTEGGEEDIQNSRIGIKIKSSKKLFGRANLGGM